MIQKAERLYPLDGGLPAASPPQKRLHAFIRAHLGRMFDPELLGDLHRIRMAEMFDPTGLLEELLDRQLAHDREHILRVLRELMGPQAPRRDVAWCEMSIVGQCFLAGPGPSDKGPRDIFGLSASEVERLAEHILTFSMAGIEAVRRKSNMHSKGERNRTRNLP
ncbi:MAG: CerR family C-terminal domain-containing protein [Candidatus Hydrogenedentes bacterium]|nr:CerR family C-terminal domain-containing protein [Candidatus Hydrogenedentota bacterium]